MTYPKTSSLSFTPRERTTVIALDSNPYWPHAHPAVVSAAINALTLINHYPQWSYEELREQAAQTFNVCPKQIKVVAGVDRAIDMLFDHFRDSRITSDRLTYSRVMAQLYHRSYLNLTPRLHYTANPSNPEGVAFTFDELVLPDCLCVVDESWTLYSGTSLLPEHADFVDRNVILRGFSKGLGLGGLRVGLIIGPQNLLEALPNDKSLSVVGLAAATEALKHLDFAKAQIEKARERAKKTVETLGNLGFQAWTTQSGFLLIRTPHATKLQEFLRQHDIYTRYYNEFPDHLRVLYGSDYDMSTFEEGVAEWLNGRG